MFCVLCMRSSDCAVFVFLFSHVCMRALFNVSCESSLLFCVVRHCAFVCCCLMSVCVCVIIDVVLMLCLLLLPCVFGYVL